MKKKIIKIILWLILLIGIFVFSIPFIIMVSNSFEEFTFSLPNPPRLFPKEFTLNNYKEIFQKYNISTYFINSVFITCVTTVLSIFVSSLSAYGFARIPFKGRETLFKIYLFTLMIPGVLNIIPQFMIINGFHLIGTRSGLILLYVGTGICGSTFFLKGFFEALPEEIAESVVVDGGSHFTIFKKIMLPISKPAVATMAIFIMMGTWDDFLTAKVILGAKESTLTLPIILHRLNGQHATKFGLVFAASIMSLIPVMFMYIISQKYFVVGGLNEGAVKS